MTEHLTIRDITVVATHEGTLLPGMDVHIADGTITRITPTGREDGPPAAHIIEGNGRFLVPGYLDLHAHPLSVADPAGDLDLMLASGITGYRQMAASPQLLTARRAGTLPANGPRLLTMPGMPLIGPVNARDEASVTETVRNQVSQGADFIKVLQVVPNVFAAALAEAHRLGVPLLGHLPARVDVREAARLGMRSIEHLGPGAGMLIACSSEETAIRDALARQPEPHAGAMSDMRTMAINPLLHASPASVDALRRAVETFDEERAGQLAETLATYETWQCPTLVRVRAMQFADDPCYRDDPDLHYMAPDTLTEWHAAATAFAERPAQDRAVYREAYELQLRLVKLFDDTGVPLLAGSDASGAGWEVPGAALHQEFDELERAGLSPLRVLQTTTCDGARFLGMDDRMGSIDEGNTADLVLLDANPLRAVRNLHTISGVVLAGRHYDKADLDHIRDGVAQARTTPP